MNVKLLSALLASTCLLWGCGGSDNDEKEVVEPPVEPPVSTAVNVDDATSMLVTVDSFDAASGALTFTLQDDAGNPISNASNYEIAYFGYPESPSTNPKAWKRWHVTQSFSCDTASDIACEGLLTETATEGQYTFNAIDLDLESKAAAGAVEKFKVAVQINGAQVSNEVELVTP